MHDCAAHRFGHTLKSRLSSIWLIAACTADGAGTFSCTWHRLGPVHLLVGEIDCKAGGKYVELKLASSHPRYFDLFQGSQSETRQWLSRACYLACIDLLVRGHRNKRTEKLDKLETLEPSTRLQVSMSDLQLLQDRLQLVASRVADPSRTYRVAFDDSLEALSVL